MLEIAAIIIGGALGWNIGRIGRRELTGMGLVIGGWTAVETVAMVPYLSVEFFLTNLAYHAGFVVIPFGIAVLLRKLQARSR